MLIHKVDDGFSAPRTNMTLVTRYGRREEQILTTVTLNSPTSTAENEEETTTVFVAASASTSSPTGQSNKTMPVTSSSTSESKDSSATTTTIIILSPSTSASSRNITISTPPILTTSTSTSTALIPSFTRQTALTDACPTSHSKRCRFLPNAPSWPAGGKECYCISSTLAPPQPARPKWDTSDFEKQGVQVKAIPEPMQLKLKADGTYDTNVGSAWWMWVDQDKDGSVDDWMRDAVDGED